MGLSIGLAAKTGYQNTESKTMSDKQIKRMDRKHNRNKAQKRDFRTQKEYKHKTDRKHSKYLDRPSRYNGGHHSNRSSYSDHHRRDRQRGYELFFMIVKVIIMDILTVTDTFLKVYFTDMIDTMLIKTE